MTKITDFRPGETKGFKITITINAVIQNIAAGPDVVTFRMKNAVDDTDAEAGVTKTADVASEGALGIAIFSLIPSDTSDLAPGKYHVDVLWEPSAGGEYVVYTDVLKLLLRVSDV